MRVDKALILAIVTQQIRTIVPELGDQPIEATQSLRDLGINSIERADIILGTMEEVGVNVPLTELSTAKNIGGLVDLIHDRQQR